METNETEEVLYAPDADNFHDEHPEGDTRRMDAKSDAPTDFPEREEQDDAEDVS